MPKMMAESPVVNPLPSLGLFKAKTKSNALNAKNNSAKGKSIRINNPVVIKIEAAIIEYPIIFHVLKRFI